LAIGPGGLKGLIMGIKFHGGPYDGVEAEDALVNKCASILRVRSDLGMRVFALMPPREIWDRLLRGESVDTSPLFPYERIVTADGPHFEWPSPGALDQALLEANLKVHQRASTALSTLNESDRRAMIRAVTKLQKTEPGSWPEEHAVQVGADPSIFLLRVGALVGFVQQLDTGQLELFDVAREDTLRLFLERYRPVGSAG
jgi:hypothetical protein